MHMFRIASAIKAIGELSRSPLVTTVPLPCIENTNSMRTLILQQLHTADSADTVTALNATAMARIFVSADIVAVSW
jgi:hypothetical protein